MNKTSYTKCKNTQKKQIPSLVCGFTLIEIMVSVAVFSIVMTISSGSLFSVLDANAKSQSQKSVMNNLNLALEGMSRNIRVGTNYHCGSGGNLYDKADCQDGAELFAFEGPSGDVNVSGDEVVYKLDGSAIMRSTNGGGSYTAITALEVVVEDLKFYVTGTSATDVLQPRVIIVVVGYAGVQEKIRTDFNIQTSVSQRQLDI